MSAARCKSCQAPIEWARTAKGRRIPLDPGSHGDGNLLVVSSVGEREMIVRGLTVGELDEARRTGQPLRRSHFQTRPDAKRHRRPR